MMIFFLQQVELKHKEIYLSWITIIFKTWGEKQMNTLSVVFSSISNPENLDLWSPDPCHLNLHCTKNAPAWKLNHMLSLPSSQYTCINVHSILFLQTKCLKKKLKKMNECTDTTELKWREFTSSTSRYHSLSSSIYINSVLKQNTIKWLIV